MFVFILRLVLEQENQAQALDLLKVLQNLKIDLEILTSTRYVCCDWLLIFLHIVFFAHPESEWL